MEAELEKLKKKLEKYEKEKLRLEKYNNDLQEQIKLSNAKLHLTKTYLFKNVEVQTEVVVEVNEDNEKVFTKELLRKCHNNFDEQTKKNNDLKDMVEEMKQAHSLTDYHYDEKSKTYLSKSTGWYYYPQCSAFFNPQDKCYYRYNEKAKTYDFLSKLEENHDAKQSDCEDDEEENEDGEVYDSDDENEDFQKFCSEGDFSKFSLKKSSKLSLMKIPNVRMIVEKSSTLEVGSLLVISYKGGKLGNHVACSVTIPDPGISPLHTEIFYDLAEKQYYVQHLSFKNSTFMNGERMTMLERRLLKHGDRLGIADECDILVHIHSNKNETCDGCEPGIIRKNNENAKAKAEREAAMSQYSKQSQTQTNSVKSGLKNLKRKYGLEQQDARSSKLPSGYSDRAAKRQKEVGSDNPYEKTAAGSAVDMPINEKNKGFQMMKKMGWKSGESVGAEKNKTTEPIDIEIRESRAGLGFNS